MACNWEVLVARELRFAIVDQSVTIEHIAGELNIIIGEFTNLRIIHPKNLSFFACTKAEAGNEVQQEKDDAGATERVSETGDRVSELVSNLNPVVIEPSTRNHCDAVEMCYVVARGM